MRVRAGLVTTIYNKALVLSNDERTQSSGDIVNLMSVDATRLQDLCTYGLIAFSGPFQVSAQAMMGCRRSPAPDHSCFYLALQPPGMVGLCRRRDHDLFRSFEHM